MTGVCGGSEAMTWVALIPSTPGRFASIKTTSGVRRRTRSMATSALSAVPTTSTSDSKLSSFLRLSTVEGTASTMTTRMACFSAVSHSLRVRREPS